MKSVLPSRLAYSTTAPWRSFPEESQKTLSNKQVACATTAVNRWVPRTLLQHTLRIPEAKVTKMPKTAPLFVSAVRQSITYDTQIPQNSLDFLKNKMTKQFWDTWEGLLKKKEEQLLPTTQPSGMPSKNAGGKDSSLEIPVELHNSLCYQRRWINCHKGRRARKVVFKSNGEFSAS